MDIFYPIQKFANTITDEWMSLSTGSWVRESVNFFIYDTIKIVILLVVVNLVMAVLRYYLPINKIRNIMVSRKWWGMDYLLAAIAGVITPFCSCSSIPLFVGFLSAGVPLGVTITFLITSPLVNEASLAVFPGLFGAKFTLIYNLVGMAVGVAGGLVISKLNMEKYIEPSLFKVNAQNGSYKAETLSVKELVKKWLEESWGISKKLIPYLLIGIGVGATIHGFVPTDFFEKYIAADNWWSVAVATIVGIPFYANSIGVIPIMEALISKGLPVGTVLAFVTATVTLSIPEALILKKVMKTPLLITFFSMTTVGIMAIGYLFNRLY